MATSQNSKHGEGEKVNAGEERKRDSKKKHFIKIVIDNNESGFILYGLCMVHLFTSQVAVGGKWTPHQFHWFVSHFPFPTQSKLTTLAMNFPKATDTPRFTHSH